MGKATPVKIYLNVGMFFHEEGRYLLEWWRAEGKDKENDLA